MKKRIGFLINNINGYIQSFVMGAESKANDLELELIVVCMPPSLMEAIEFATKENYEIDAQTLEYVLEVIVDLNIQGLIVNTEVTDFTDPNIIAGAMAEKGIPLVSISTDIEGASLVQSTNYESSKLGVEHLINKHSCGKIAYISGPKGNLEAEDRRKGYEHALESHGIAYDPQIVIEGNWFADSGKAAVKYIYDELGLKPDAIVGANDTMILGVAKELERRGIDVPKDVALLGFDNESEATIFSFSTIAQPMESMAEKAVEELYRRIQLKQTVPEKIHVSNPLILRKSCGCDIVARTNLFINDKVDKQEQCWAFITDKIDSMYFVSNSLKQHFSNDVRRFWSELSIVVTEKCYGALAGLEDIVSEILKEHLTQNINITYWLELIHDFRRDCETLGFIEPRMQHFFGCIEKEANRAIERAQTQAVWDNEERAYLLTKVMAQRTMAAENYCDLAKITLDELGELGAEFGCLAISTENKVFDIVGMRQQGITCNNLIEGVSANYFHAMDYGAATQEQKNNILILLGTRNHIDGFIVTELSTLTNNWIAYSAFQLFISQAIRNIIQKKQILKSEQKAIIASEAKSDFLSRMTHELRTPLNGIISMATLTLEEGMSPSQRNAIEIIEKSGNRLLSLINEILDFSKIDEDKLELEYSDFNLATCVEEVLGSLYAIADEKNIWLSYSIDNAVPLWIKQDEARLRQVIVNLVGNAIKFTTEGYVRIIITMESNLIKITVEDSGVGISKDKIDNLFQPFSQGDASIHKHFGGTGLGLVISHRICKLMGGNISVDMNFNCGAKFDATIEHHEAKAGHILKLHERRLNPSKLKLPNIVLTSEKEDRISAFKQMFLRWKIPFTVYTPKTLQSFLEKYQDIETTTYFIFDDQYKQLIQDIKKTYPRLQCSLLKMRNKKETLSMDCEVIHNPIKPSQVLERISQVTPAGQDKRKLIFDIDFAKRHPMRILYVEDDRTNQTVARMMLNKLGYSIEIAENGQESLNLLEEKHFDVILMDMSMPVMDGETAIKHIRMNQYLRYQPYIIVLTADNRPRERIRLIENIGANEYLTKPIDPYLLQKFLEDASQSLTHTRSLR